MATRAYGAGESVRWGLNAIILWQDIVVDCRQHDGDNGGNIVGYVLVICRNVMGIANALAIWLIM